MMSIADSTYAGYASQFRLYVSYCVAQNVSPLSPNSLHNFVFACYRNGSSFGKANGTTSAIKFWCRINGIPPPSTPLTTLGLRAYRRHYRRQKPPVWFTEEQLLTLLERFDPLQIHHYTLLVLSFYTLVRPKEILTLTWANVFLAKKYIWLPLSKNDQEGTGTYVRLLPAAHRALTILSNAFPHQPTDKIFPINQATTNPWLNAKCKAANLPPYNWYALKHGGATHLALLGWSLKNIQAHGRWKTKAAARIYIHAPVFVD